MENYKITKQSQIDGDFEGFDDGVLFKLMDGTYWLQDEYKYWYHYAFCPKVNILQANNRSYIQIDGQNKLVAVRQIFDVIESQIDGDFNGWEGETEYQLTNGQIWKQCTYNYEYTYSFMPEVLIYCAGGDYRMLVEGTSADVCKIN